MEQLFRQKLRLEWSGAKIVFLCVLNEFSFSIRNVYVFVSFDVGTKIVEEEEEEETKC